MKRHFFLVVVIILLAVILFGVVEILFIKLNGTMVPAPKIPRDAQTWGQGPALTYVVMGDSTSIGQGTEYENSYAVSSAEHLSHNYRLKFVNVGVSGARTKDVQAGQLHKAAAYKPDLVLLAVGANDATHFTSGYTVQNALQQIINGLRQANPQVKIVITGSPAMDAVPRFPWPAKQLMGLRTRQINNAFAPVIAKNHLVFAPIADQTRAAFLADPRLFAPDKFHPNMDGYYLWKPIINHSLDAALAKPTS